MELPVHEFHKVSLLITHYNRSRSLERLLQSFENIQCRFGEIVVSDDGSKAEHLAYVELLQERFNFTLVITKVNKGLGNNINKGQDAVTLPYTLYVQEAFEPLAEFPQCFKNSLDIIQERPDLDIIRFYAYFEYPYARSYKEGFTEMVFHHSPLYLNHLKFYVYSHHPHLRRSNFLQKFGRYPEDIKGDKTEYRMAVSFIKKKGKGLLYKDYTKIFYQENSTEETSTIKRNLWKESNNIFIHLMREAYRHFKFNCYLLLR